MLPPHCQWISIGTATQLPVSLRESAGADQAGQGESPDSVYQWIYKPVTSDGLAKAVVASQ